MNQQSRQTRREVLGALGGLTGSALLAGCIAGDDSDGPENGSGGNGNGTGNGNGNARPLPASRSGDGPLPETCPEYDGVSNVVCYDAVADDTDAVDVYLEPSTRAVGEGDSVEFTLYNNSDQTFRTNFYNWHVHKYLDDEWHFVAPQFWNEPLMTVSPGDTHTWTVTIDNEGIEAGESVPNVSGTEEVELTGLGGGYYAFRARGWFEDDSYEEDMALAATFEFDTGAMMLTPTSAVETTAWDGETLVAATTRGDSDDEAFTFAAYELKRVEEATAEPAEMITEQVLRNDQLRDAIALAYEHDTDRVRLEEHTGITPLFGVQSDHFVEYHDDSYKISTRELDEAR